MNKSKPILVAGLSSLAALLLASTSASATNITWAATSGTWDTSATNWSGATGTPWDATNGSTNTAVFTTSGTSTISDSVYANAITFNPSLGNFTISSGTLNLAGTTPTISQLDSADTLTISSTLLGSAGMVKAGAGTLVLSGSNGITGTTTINGGSLVLDYSGLSNSAAPISSSASATLDMGTLVFNGKTSGATTLTTTGTLNIGSSSSSNPVANALYLKSNGGSGISLTFSRLNLLGASTNTNLIDLSSSASNSLIVNSIGSNVINKNGVLMYTSDASTGRANLVVRDSSGYGFATLSGATSGTIGRLTTGTTLDATSSNTATNFFLTSAGTVTRTAALDFNTITINSTAGAITLDMGSNNLQASAGNGRGILVSGDHDVNITGNGTIETAGVWFHNYASGTLTIGLNMSKTMGTSWIIGGTGLTVWSGTQSSSSYIDKLIVNGGIFRITATQDFTSGGGIATGGGNIAVSSGGVLEIGADLNGATAGDFSNVISSSRLRFYGNSGVSASGSNRIVGFTSSGALQSLTWGSSSFLTNEDNTTDGNYSFLLSSDKSDATVTVQNNIALGSLQRTVQVADGSAATDAVLSGTISDVGGLTKTGLGTLSISGSNTYTGATLVNAGELDVNGSLSASSAVSVGSGATLGGSGKVNGSVTGTNATISGNGLSMGDAILDGTSRIAGTNTANSITVRSGTTANQGTTTSTSGLSVKAGATFNNTGSASATTVTVENTANLKNNGSITASTVDVSGVLDGTGTITGALSIKSGGELAPGNSPGTTTVNGSLTVDGAAKVSLQIDKVTVNDSLVAGLGGNYDQIIVNGTVTLAQNSVLDFTTLSNAKVGDVFKLILNDGTDAINGTFTTVKVNGIEQQISNNVFTFGDLTYDLSYTANADGSGVGALGNDLTLTVVPEPATWAMVVGGLGMLVFGQRLRRGKNA